MKKLLYFLVIITITVFNASFLSGCANSDNSQTTSTTSTTNTTLSTETTAVNSSEKITKTKAENIALKDAGFTLENATVKTIKKDIENGKEVYEINFEADNFQYEYSIDIETGKIVSYEKDKINSPNTVVNSTDSQVTVLIPSSQALRIALVDAGIKEEDAIIEPVDLDAENGVQYYEVNFRVDRVEYEYEINAKTGEIITADRD